MPADKQFAEILVAKQKKLIDKWIVELSKPGVARTDLISSIVLNDQAGEFVRLFVAALAKGANSIDSPEWDDVRSLLADLSRSRANKGYSPSETAQFVLSLKQPLFDMARSEISGDADLLFDVLWSTTKIIDSLGLYTTEVSLRSREEVIRRQQGDMLELSTPVVKLWAGVLALPIIGTLDSARTQIVMENLLQAIVDEGAEVAIIDITGVPTVDTLTSQHLLKTVAAARLMGAECIISGIRPQIAQTIVHLGVDLSDVVTKATLADAFTVALRRVGLTVTRAQAKG